VNINFILGFKNLFSYYYINLVIINAKKKPVKYTNIENRYIAILNFLNRLQALAFNGSAGQGAFLVYQIKKPLIRISKPETINNIILYFDNTIRKGIFDTKPARTAPAPIATNKDGKAQQSNVPRLVNKLRDGTIKFFDDIGFIFSFFYLLFQQNNPHL
tara:strand:- start:343 stop:819 length:477 start_codon:yes stop_codon:yes gene_type:complete